MIYKSVRQTTVAQSHRVVCAGLQAGKAERSLSGGDLRNAATALQFYSLVTDHSLLTAYCLLHSWGSGHRVGAQLLD